MADPRARFIISADDKATAALRKVRGEVDGVGKVFSRLNVAIGGLIGGGALTVFVKNALDSADQIQKLSIRLGASTEALSQYKYVADLTGVSFNQLTTAWQRMTRRIAEAALGTGEAQNALKELGLEATRLNQLKPDQQFEVLADAINQVGNSSDQVRIAMKLFDSEGVALLQTMKGGSEAIRAMREEADAIGLTLDQNAADAAAKANDAMTKLGAATDALAITMVSALAPAIADVVNWLQVSLPRGAQFASDAFYSLQSQILDGVGAWSNALASAEFDLSRLASSLGFEDLARAFYKAGEDYAEIGNIASKAAIRVGELVDSTQSHARSLQAGITFNELYNASLANSVTSTKELSKEQRKAEKDALRAAEERQRLEQKLADEKAAREERARDIIKTLDPFSDTRDQIAEIQALAAEFPKLADSLAEVEFDIQAKFDEIGEDARSAAQQVDDAWKDLGLTFESAFEDAIVNGKELSEVLKSLEQDIIRIVTRRLVTEPLGNFVSGAVGSVFGSIPGFASGGSFEIGSQTSAAALSGTDNRLIMFAGRDGERVTVEPPGQRGGGMMVVMNISTPDANSFRASRGQIEHQVRQMVRRAGRND